MIFLFPIQIIKFKQGDGNNVEEKIFTDSRWSYNSKPDTALDDKLKSELINTLIARLSQSQTVLIVSHNLNDLIFLADRILSLEGRPLIIKKEFILNKPQKVRTKQFVEKKFKEIKNILKV